MGRYGRLLSRSNSTKALIADFKRRNKTILIGSSSNSTNNSTLDSTGVRGGSISSSNDNVVNSHNRNKNDNRPKHSSSSNSCNNKSNNKPDIVNWKELQAVMSELIEGMNIWDLSNVTLLQTLDLSQGDVNSVAFGRNYVLATGSR
jgi:hypothetical protein